MPEEPELLGWVKLYRKTLDSAVFADPDLLRVWIACLLTAGHRETWVTMARGHEPIRLVPGQFITGVYQFHEMLYPKKRRSNPHPRTSWRLLHALQDLGNLVIQATTHFSIVSICKWERYQNRDDESISDLSSHCHTTVTPLSTNKNVKKKEEETPYVRWSEETDRFDISEGVLARWRERHPDLDLDGEIAKAEAWYQDNPKKRKRDHRRFLGSWLRRAADRVADSAGKDPLGEWRPFTDEDAAVVWGPKVAPA